MLTRKKLAHIQLDPCPFWGFCNFFQDPSKMLTVLGLSGKIQNAQIMCMTEIITKALQLTDYLIFHKYIKFFNEILILSKDCIELNHVKGLQYD